MCGIVGYIGGNESLSFLIEGLKRLEYRGYDSAGLAILNTDGIKVVRRPGHLAELEKAAAGMSLTGKLGIGHTRWATHGRPTEANAHPHLDCAGKIAVAHNGIIENFLSLRERLQASGHLFRSETDTEVIVHLIEENYHGDLTAAVCSAVKQLEGSFAIVVISSEHPDLIVAARLDSPLVLGLGQGEYFVASDIPAALEHTRDFLILDNGEIAEVTRGGIKISTLDGKPVSRKSFEVKWDIAAAEKGGYEDFMLKEIYEQPHAIKETFRGRITDAGEIKLDEVSLTPEEVKKIDKIFIIACGTSYHAGLVAKQAIEWWVRIPVEIDISSEFRYRAPILDEKTLVIAITQSGETADTLAGVKEAKKEGAKVIAVTNVVGSSITREAEGIFYTHAGPEIGVAATKTLTSQMVALYILALYLAHIFGKLSSLEIRKIIHEIFELPELIERILEDTTEIEKVAGLYHQRADFLYLGRGTGLPVALEGALKLKEISYIHAEGYPAGEMKHGPIALIDKNVPVVVVATEGHVYSKMIDNIQEVKARDASIIAVATEGDKEIHSHAEHVFFVPRTTELLSAVTAVVPLQLMAYYMAKLRGCNVDQPRNLAKSVTVE